MSPTIRRLAVLGALLVLPVAGQAQAVSWVLALPPIKDKPGESAPNRPHDPIRDRLDTAAAVVQWEQAQVFADGAVCEDARLQALAAYDAEVRSVDPDKASGAEKERVLHLAQRAFARCVPAFAFSGRDARG
ncbi:MAG TPA: hypothetical protein VF948_00055 [Methylomirabilota bacterium]|jgi:hypothetical protein